MNLSLKATTRVLGALFNCISWSSSTVRVGKWTLSFFCHKSQHLTGTTWQNTYDRKQKTTKKKYQFFYVLPIYYKPNYKSKYFTANNLGDILGSVITILLLSELLQQQWK